MSSVPRTPATNVSAPLTPNIPKFASYFQNQYGIVGREDRLKRMAKEAESQLLAMLEPHDFITRFVEHPDKPKTRIYESAHKSVLQRAHSIPTGRGEHAMYGPLVSMLQASADAVCPDQTSSHHLIIQDTHKSFASSLDAEDDSTSATDLAIFRQNTAQLSWLHADCFLEAKPKDTQDPIQKDDDGRPTVKSPGHLILLAQFHDAARRMMRECHRCHVFGIGIFGYQARFFRWDHFSCIVSETFNYTKDAGLIINFIDCLSHNDDIGRGFDSTVRLIPLSSGERALRDRLYEMAISVGILDKGGQKGEGVSIYNPIEKIDTPVDQWERFITIGERLFNSKTLFGRGTKTQLAFRASDANSGNIVDSKLDTLYRVIKESWRDERRQSEGEIYAALVQVDRGSKTDSGHSGRWMFDADQTLAGVARMESDVDYGQFSDQGRHPYRTTKLFEDWPGRILHRSVSRSIGVPLSRFQRSKQIVEALRDVVKGHQNMNERGALFRDMSASNSMRAAFPPLEGHVEGFLIDIEYAFLRSPDRQQALLGMTGTAQFMSIARLELLQRVAEYKQLEEPTDPRPQEPHEVWHDLESVFWILLFIILRHCDTNWRSHPQKICDLLDSPKASSDKKRNFILTGASTFVVVGNTRMTKLVRDFADLVWSHYVPERERRRYSWDELDQLTYGRVLNLFDDTLNDDNEPDDQKWPKADKSLPFKVYISESARINSDILRSSTSSSSSTSGFESNPVFTDQSASGGDQPHSSGAIRKSTYEVVSDPEDGIEPSDDKTKDPDHAEPKRRKTGRT